MSRIIVVLRKKRKLFRENAQAETTIAIMKLSQIQSLGVLITIQQMVSAAEGLFLTNEASSRKCRCKFFPTTMKFQFEAR